MYFEIFRRFSFSFFYYYLYVYYYYYCYYIHSMARPPYVPPGTVVIYDTTRYRGRRQYIIIIIKHLQFSRYNNCLQIGPQLTQTRPTRRRRIEIRVATVVATIIRYYYLHRKRDNNIM